ncbi:MAG: hypothetical protein HY709_03005, partial [Candidatus Latescibacteria bacterium]|nr:hypothetical protein [Candidatus Latescibacterota bacterium]
MAFTLNDMQDFFHLLEEHPQWQTQMRMLLMAKEGALLPERMDRLTEVVERLTLAQARTEEHMEQLAQAQARTEERLERLEATVERLAQAQARTEERLAQLSEEVKALVTWQRGEAGRREGERYEQQVVRRAVALFNGGQGGATDHPLVQQWLTEHLRPRLGEEILAAEEDPFLADLIWWKG